MSEKYHEKINDQIKTTNERTSFLNNSRSDPSELMSFVEEVQQNDNGSLFLESYENKKRTLKIKQFDM